jgi:hypothetical protein
MLPEWSALFTKMNAQLKSNDMEDEDVKRLLSDNGIWANSQIMGMACGWARGLLPAGVSVYPPLYLGADGEVQSLREYEDDPSLTQAKSHFGLL